MFEITHEERVELIALLEYDFVKFPKPFKCKRGVWRRLDLINLEITGWMERSEKIDRFVDEYLKTK